MGPSRAEKIIAIPACWDIWGSSAIIAYVISKLPRWVLVGGFFLAFVAGMINAVAILSFAHQPVSHLTATTTRLGVALAETDESELVAMAGVIGSFFVGAMFSGWLIRTTALQCGPRYGTAMWIEAVTLCAAAILLSHRKMIGIGLCCFSCGLQNGLAATFSGAIVRTTHMTGLFTDLGVHLGQIVRGQAADLKRLRLYALLISGFIAGGVAAAKAMSTLGSMTLFLPAVLIACIALGYRHLSRTYISGS